MLPDAERPISTGPTAIVAGVLVALSKVKVPAANEAEAVPEGRPVIVPVEPVTDPDWVILIWFPEPSV